MIIFAMVMTSITETERQDIECLCPSHFGTTYSSMLLKKHAYHTHCSPEPCIWQYCTGPFWVSTHLFPVPGLSVLTSVPPDPAVLWFSPHSQPPPQVITGRCSAFGISHPEPPLFSDCFDFECATSQLCQATNCSTLSKSPSLSLFLLSPLGFHCPRQPHYCQDSKCA